MKRPGYRTYSNKDARVTVGDCVRGMEALPRSAADLVFADPPFNFGAEYDQHVNDNKPRREYEAWTEWWIRESVRVLRPGGSIFVHVPDQIVSVADRQLCILGLDRRNWIILHQEFGQYGESRFITSKVHLLYYVKPGPRAVFNVEDVLEPSLRLRIGDKRTQTAKFKGMRPFLDVWYGPLLGRVQGNNEERRKNHPNQLPEMYMSRILRTASNEGDTVLDPFLGSGTTGVVAVALKRKFVGFEASPKLAASAWERITKIGPKRDVHGQLWTGGESKAF